MLRVAMLGATSQLPAVPATGLFVSVNDPRPLKEALAVVEQHYRVAVTFEEAPIQAADEIDDVTRSVSRSPDPAPRVLVARGGPFEFAWSDTATPVAEVLTALVERYNDGGYAGRYAVLEDGRGGLHVVPVSSRASSGGWVPRPSMLSVPVTMAAGRIDGFRLLEVITTQVSRQWRDAGQPHTSLGVGMMPNNLVAQTSLDVAAGTYPARDLLVRLRQAARLPISWRLMCQPGYRQCLLNIHMLR